MRFSPFFSSVFVRSFSSSVRQSVVGNGSVLLIEMHKEATLNALTPELVFQLREALSACDRSPVLKAAVITGFDRAFSVGVDVSLLADACRTPRPAETAKKILSELNLESILRIQKPLIAAVSGYALGGGLELALMCDIIFAAETAKFAFPECKLGLFPGCGGTQRLVASVGRSNAMNLILTGSHISASDAQKMNLVSKIFGSHTITVAECVKTAQLISKYEDSAVRIAKQLINDASAPTESLLNKEANLFCKQFENSATCRLIENFVQRKL